MKMKQNRRTVTLTLDRVEFAILLEDAAKSMTGKVEPLRADVVRLAAEFSQFEARFNSNSGSVYLLRDIKRILGDPLLGDVDARGNGG
jgi:hypothetical protein